jgi:hypothetical protein
MAAIPVTFIGTLTYTDLGVGGGPAPGGPPVGIWPSPGVPTPPIYYPGVPTPPIYYPGAPAHPISPGGPPPGIWPGPGVPTPPIYYPPAPPVGIWPGPGVPTPPIYYPPPPVGIWPSPGTPSHPIAPGGEEPPDAPSGDGGRWAWSPIYGWVWLPVGSGDKPHPPQPSPEAPAVNPLS